MPGHRPARWSSACPPSRPPTTGRFRSAWTADALVWAERVAGGSYTHKVVAAGTTVRLTDLDGDACAHLLLYRAGEPWERLNVADTVKVQWQAYLGEGSLLLSDQGRVLASVVSDSSGHHDALCGGSSRLRNDTRYGSGSAEGPTPAARELFLLAAAKHGLGARDLPPCCSLFQGVRVDPDSGALQWNGSCGGPSAVELRAELPLLVLIANTAHPLDARPDLVVRIPRGPGLAGPAHRARRLAGHPVAGGPAGLPQQRVRSGRPAGVPA